MPTVEIDELEFQQNKTLRDTVAKMMANPKAKKKLLEAEKILFPEKKIPEIDEPNPFEEELKATRKTVEDLQASITKDQTDREHNEKIRELKQQRDEGFSQLRSQGWIKESLEAVEKLMEEKGILDPMIAAAYYEKQHPPADPINPSGYGSQAGFIEPVTAETDEFTKQLLATRGDDMGNLALREASKTLGEMRGRPGLRR